MALNLGPATALILGLAAALFWGTGDYLVRTVEARIGVRRALLRGHLISLIFVPIAFPLVTEPSLAAVSPTVWALALVAALANLGMMATLYRGLAAGPLAVVAPIAGSYAGVTGLLAIATGTDVVGAAAGAALVCIFIGVILAGIERDEEGLRNPGRGAVWAIACALFGGFSYWLQGAEVIPAIGPIVTLAINTSLMVVACTLIRPKSGEASPPLDSTTVALGLLNGLGFLAYLLGLSTGRIVIVSIVGSMAGGVTALLGAVLLRQPMARLQWVGVAMILAGIAVLHGFQA
jgi:drug/metabolite transporter (DMT)-like permease